MYSKILVPLDGSAPSEEILPYARFFSRALKTPVELLNVLESDVVRSLADPDHHRYVDVVEGELRSRSITYLEGVARSFPKGSTVHCFAEVGEPAQVVVDRVSSDPKALIAMATHGRSGMRGWMLGSVADKVIHAASNPVLLVREGETARAAGEAPLKSIVVPLDGSRLAESILPLVTGLAQEMALEIVLLRVHSILAGVYLPEGGMYGPEFEEMVKMSRDEARGYLDEKASELRGRGIKRVSSVLLEGSAAAEIMEFARKTPDNLVAMCSHGRSGIGRWVLGSVTDRVVRHSGDPVLVVRASAREWRE